MAASKPISWLYLKKTSLFSLNNNFGTFNSCSGLFPFRHTTLSYYVRLCKIHHCPSESKFSPIKSSRFPDVYKTMLLSLRKQHNLSEITVLYLLWCALNYILTYVSRKTSYSSQGCLSLTYHSSLDIFTTITHSAFYKPDHGKITTLRVSN